MKYIQYTHTHIDVRRHLTHARKLYLFDAKAWNNLDDEAIL